MFLRTKDNMSFDYMVTAFQDGKIKFFSDNEKSGLNAVVYIDKQKTIELIEFLQKCVKEME